MMKKATMGFAVTAAAGFAVLSAAPANAAHLPFPNCDAAAAAGVYNIPRESPAYGSHLDADDDGFGCDAAGTPAYNPALVTPHLEPAPPPTTPPQVMPMPVGGVDTGVAQNPADNTGALALGSGLLLAVAGAGAYIVRRRGAS
ncbi:hypothetical protein GCM10027403_26540 [Arthrobacter tecti]